MRQDQDPYVRKTSAICIPKALWKGFDPSVEMKPARLLVLQVYDINPELVEDQGFVEILKARLSPSPIQTWSLGLLALQPCCLPCTGPSWRRKSNGQLLRICEGLTHS